jgi:hypothetical protein
MAPNSNVKAHVSQTGEPISGTPTAVAERCVRLWDCIIKCISQMRDELEKMHNDGPLPNGTLSTANGSRFRSYAMLAKRLSVLLGSAQDGLKWALEIREFAELERSDLSSWEKAKLRMKPELRDWIEESASQLIAKGKRLKRQKSGLQDTSDTVEELSGHSDRIRSSTDETADLIMQLRVAEVSRLEAQLRAVEEIVAGGLIRDGLSKGVNHARFKRHLSEMKRLVDLLRSSQRGFRSALLIQKALERKTSVAAGWASQERRHEKLLQETAEKMMLNIHERMRIFPISSPELDKIRLREALFNK